MRGNDENSGSFSYIDLEARVRADHPLRPIREIANTALAALSGDFAALYSGMGRPSVPPEKLLRAMLLQAFYSVRSERQLMERIEFDLLFRWFVGVREPRPAPPRPGSPHRSARPSRAGLRLVHRGLQHARPERGKGPARRTAMPDTTLSNELAPPSCP